MAQNFSLNFSEVEVGEDAAPILHDYSFLGRT